MKLSLGSGPYRLGPDWTHIDKDPSVGPDLCLKIGEEQLAYEPGSISEIYCSHLLEHYSTERAGELLVLWVKWLKRGGVLWVAVPDANFLMGEALRACSITTERWDVWHDCMRHLFAWQRDPDDTHRYAYCEESLRALMALAGLNKIERFFPWVNDSTLNACIMGCDGQKHAISLNLKGVKP